MAVGDVTFFHQFKVDLGNKIHDMDTDTWKVGLITRLLPLLVLMLARIGAELGLQIMQRIKLHQGNYATGGPSLTSLAFFNSAGTISWAAGKISIASHASNPTNARWAIIYNSTDANKERRHLLI